MELRRTTLNLKKEKRAAAKYELKLRFEQDATKTNALKVKLRVVELEKVIRR